MVVFKKFKCFEVVFTDPEKVYCGGEKVTGKVLVEVCEVTRVTAVKLLACGVAKVVWSQNCKQEMEYLRVEDTLHMDDQPTGERMGWGLGWIGGITLNFGYTFIGHLTLGCSDSNNFPYWGYRGAYVIIRLSALDLRYGNDLMIWDLYVTSKEGLQVPAGAPLHVSSCIVQALYILYNLYAYSII